MSIQSVSHLYFIEYILHIKHSHSDFVTDNKNVTIQTRTSRHMLLAEPLNENLFVTDTNAHKMMINNV